MVGCGVLEQHHGGVSTSRGAELLGCDQDRAMEKVPQPTVGKAPWQPGIIWFPV